MHPIILCLVSSGIQLTYTYRREHVNILWLLALHPKNQASYAIPTYAVSQLEVPRACDGKRMSFHSTHSHAAVNRQSELSQVVGL